MTPGTPCDADAAGHSVASLWISQTLAAAWPKKCAAHIFDPLYTTKELGRGTGLGLFVVRQVILSTGAASRLKAKRDAARAFVIRLPVAHNDP